MSTPSPRAPSSISISCPPNQSGPYTTVGLTPCGTAATAVPNPQVQCWLDYGGNTYKTPMLALRDPTHWMVGFQVQLPDTGTDYGDLTAHLFDSAGVEIASSTAVEVMLSASGINCTAADCA
jgi:hypothetical protein